MPRTLALLRHGRAAGQGPDAVLTSQGALQIEKVAAVLKAEGWRPAAVFVSPYSRALESARVFVAAIGLGKPAAVLHELIPESEPLEALAAIDAAAPGHPLILIVSHMPLVARIALELTEEEVSFTPATFVEIADQGNGRAHLVRRLSPEEL